MVRARRNALHTLSCSARARVKDSKMSNCTRLRAVYLHTDYGASTLFDARLTLTVSQSSLSMQLSSQLRSDRM